MRERMVKGVLVAAVSGFGVGVSVAAESEPLKHDAERNIHIPAAEHLQDSIRVSAVYDETSLQLRFEFETDQPSWYHQYWVYEDGAWVRHGSAAVGPDEYGLYEDRIAVAFDDGSVEGYSEVGGYLVQHTGVRGLPGEIGAEEVRAHPWLGEELGESDVRKFIPQSRTTWPDVPTWDDIRPPDELRRMRQRGEFIDTWQWRSHRSNPIGYADNGYVLEYRHSSSGRGMYTTNWDDDSQAPAYMLDPDRVGRVALRIEDLHEQAYGQDDPYFISEDTAVPFDPDHDWQEGDAIPQRLLREPSGSRGAIRADGRYEDGAWRVSMTRTLVAPDPRDSKTFRRGEVYNMAIAVHTRATGGRWHMVSMPIQIAIGGDGEARVRAERARGDLDSASAEWVTVPLIYPGRLTWAEVREEGTDLRRSLDRAVASPLDASEVRALLTHILEHDKSE